MRKKRHTPEQIVRKLREAEAETAAGKSIEEVCKNLEVGQQDAGGRTAEPGGVRDAEGGEGAGGGLPNGSMNTECWYIAMRRACSELHSVQLS